MKKLTPEQLVEGLKRLNAEEFGQFCMEATYDNLGRRLIELLSLEEMARDNADHELASRMEND